MLTVLIQVRRGRARLLAATCACAALALAGAAQAAVPAAAQPRAAARESGRDASATPPGREWASFAYYPPRHELVLFGGNAFKTVYGDTWTSPSGSTWTEQHPAASPSARTGAGIAYDPATRQLLLFGGGSTPSGPFNADTWTWNGTTWTQLHPATSPPGREFGDLVYDAAAKSVILFAGWHGSYLDDTWSWNGTTWTRLSPAASPGGRDSDAFADDPAAKTAIMFGGFRGTGYVPGDTWSWNGTTWAKLSPPASPGTDVVAWQAAYDAASKQLLLFGGDAGGKKPFLNSTWTWTGTSWARLNPATSPPGRAYGSMTYDSADQRVVLYAGRANSPAASFPTTAWDWDGSTWSSG